eukprot:Gregarina_sp_Poly_1__7154@NODE_391_length_8961_cov_136_980886_g320_i0_p4_GENE_NODE_391_length_8961_cov_136_980886_g320_i0NODE_391_length_8961_cov_136_980886_g320_i0_p4_ORF_typecomplete_len159_score27_73_NODE_391_length_8961_cov_136_980886_g320_i073497825
MSPTASNSPLGVQVAMSSACRTFRFVLAVLAVFTSSPPSSSVFLPFDFFLPLGDALGVREDLDADLGDGDSGSAVPRGLGLGDNSGCPAGTVVGGPVCIGVTHPLWTTLTLGMPEGIAGANFDFPKPKGGTVVLDFSNAGDPLGIIDFCGIADFPSSW